MRATALLTPGRACPVSYRYDPVTFREQEGLRAETLWIAGGLYGNPFALERLVELYEGEPGSKALVFNGDFHWFDVHENQFSKIDDAVARYFATRGNVETELAADESDAGCGCGYPGWVDDETVSRSNNIIASLRQTAMQFPEARKKLAALPMHLVAAVGGERVAVVHGDAESLAGWGFAQEALADPQGIENARRGFPAQWPPGSDAHRFHRSYYERIANGPRYTVEQALRRAAAGSPRLAA